MAVMQGMGTGDTSVRPDGDLFFPVFFPVEAKSSYFYPLIGEFSAENRGLGPRCHL